MFTCFQQICNFDNSFYAVQFYPEILSVQFYMFINCLISMYLAGGKGRKKRRRMGGKKPNASGGIAGVRKAPVSQSPLATQLRTDYLWLPEPVTGTTLALWLPRLITNALALSCSFFKILVCGV